MVDLVFWSFVIALVPLSLGIAGQLISSLLCLLDSLHSRGLVEPAPRNHRCRPFSDRLSSSGSFSG
jgi:hypothetical protein